MFLTLLIYMQSYRFATMRTDKGSTLMVVFEERTNTCTRKGAATLATQQFHANERGSMSFITID